MAVFRRRRSIAPKLDEALHDHPYQAMGIALGVGALIGYLVSRRYSGNGASARRETGPDLGGG